MRDMERPRVLSPGNFSTVALVTMAPVEEFAAALAVAKPWK